MLRIAAFTFLAGAATLALGTLTAPIAAAAQDGVPSYAQPAYVSSDETIHGRIRSVDGAFTVLVDDDRGFIDNVRLHGGTIINPTGLSLSPGMTVTVLGVNAGATFDANEIDTPYTYSGPLPTPVYLGPGYWCPGFAYGYGPSFGLAIAFGEGRPWRYEHRPFYGRPWNGRGYFGSAVGPAPLTSVGRLPEQHPIPNPSQRYPTERAQRAPSAFAGRSFASPSRSTPATVSGTTFFSAGTATRTLPAEPRSTFLGGSSPAHLNTGPAFAGRSAPAAAAARGSTRTH